jgi:hypothetical protein
MTHDPVDTVHFPIQQGDPETGVWLDTMASCGAQSSAAGWASAKVAKRPRSLAARRKDASGTTADGLRVHSFHSLLADPCHLHPQSLLQRYGWLRNEPASN